MANKIHLIDNFYFTADENQFMLMQCGTRKKIDRKTRKETNEMIDYEDTVGFYTELSTLLQACVTQRLRNAVMDGEVNSLKECIRLINDKYNKIKDITI